MKAVDFLFDEGRKFLEDKRKHRESGEKLADDQTDAIVEDSIKELPRDKVIISKEDAEKQNIDESLWLEYEDRVKHLISLLKIYSKNYYLAREQKAKWGTALVPSIVVHNLDEAEKSLSDIIKQLETTLSKIYHRRVIVDCTEE